MPYWFGPINFDSCTLTEVSYNEKYNRVSDNNTVTICDCWYKGIQRGEKVHSKVILFLVVLRKIELFQCPKFPNKCLVLALQHSHPVLQTPDIFLLLTATFTCCLSAKQQYTMWQLGHFNVSQYSTCNVMFSHLFFISLISLFLPCSSTTPWLAREGWPGLLLLLPRELVFTLSKDGCPTCTCK